LLLVAGQADAALTVELDGELVSRPYVELTARMVADFAGRVELGATLCTAQPSAYRPRSYAIEPDASAASYVTALAAAGGHDLSVPGLGSSSLQGDQAFTGLLARMGARCEVGADRTRVIGGGPLAGIDADLHHISDTVMTLAAIAPLAQGPTTIRNVANIRIKETDRLAATVAELRRLGQEVEHGDDWLRIHPRPIRPATVACYRDHRMAMAFAVLGACTGAVTIEDPACVAKTYPGFWDDLAALYPTRPW
jgi:3-phosphoshikimate 1-carboxyvinyltransferase